MLTPIRGARFGCLNYGHLARGVPSVLDGNRAEIVVDVDSCLLRTRRSQGAGEVRPGMASISLSPFVKPYKSGACWRCQLLWIYFLSVRQISGHVDLAAVSFGLSMRASKGLRRLC